MKVTYLKGSIWVVAIVILAALMVLIEAANASQIIL